MGHDTFISYSKVDKTMADAVCATLESSGIRCWIAPRDVMPGLDWGEAIVKAIAGSRVMILVFSSNSNASPQVRREVQRAFEKGLTVIPLRVEDVTPNEGLEYYIGPVHWLDAITPPLDAHLRDLATKVRLLLGEEAPVAAETDSRRDHAAWSQANPSGGTSPTNHRIESETNASRDPGTARNTRRGLILRCFLLLLIVSAGMSSVAIAHDTLQANQPIGLIFAGLSCLIWAFVARFVYLWTRRRNPGIASSRGPGLGRTD